MKKVVLFALVLAICGMLHISVLAQENRDEISDGDVAIAPEDYEGVPRYLVTFIKSSSDTSIRSATVVTVVNQSSVSCNVRVQWFRATDPVTPLCTNNRAVDPGVARQFCSRPLNSNITQCNNVCGPGITGQGKAIVLSTAGFDCSLIGVEARVYYTTGVGDTAISAISNSKIVFTGEGNLGD